MFDSLFASKNKKLVLRLQKEHQNLVGLAGDIIDAYEKKNDTLLRKKLEALKKVALIHLMTEDVEFYRLLKDSKRSTDEITSLIDEFEHSFVAIKLALIDFLDKYTVQNAYYDGEFIGRFKEIVGVLGKRIEFEEAHLYTVLRES